MFKRPFPESISVSVKMQSSTILTQNRTHTHTTVLQLSGFCLGQPGWAGTRTSSTRRDIINPLTPIVVSSHPLFASSIYYDPWHHSCSIYVPDSLFHNLSPSFLWSTCWLGMQKLIHVSIFLEQNLTYVYMLPSELFLQIAQWRQLLHNFQQIICFHNR